MLSALDFRTEEQWFDAQSLPSRCFLRQDTGWTSIDTGWTSIDTGWTSIDTGWTSIPSRGK